jgi:Ca2+-binding EF-hand superfamily protein/ankyrin repeat protein
MATTAEELRQELAELQKLQTELLADPNLDTDDELKVRAPARACARALRPRRRGSPAPFAVCVPPGLQLHAHARLPLQENLGIVEAEISDLEVELAMLDPPSAMKASPLPADEAEGEGAEAAAAAAAAPSPPAAAAAAAAPASITDAVWSGNAAAVEAALAADPESIGATYTAGGGMALVHAAVQQGHMDVLRLLLESGAPADAPKDDGATALLLAAAEGSVEGLQMLLFAGADPHFALEDGTSVLHIAAGAGQSDVLHELLAADDGLEVDVLDGNRDTALARACAGGHDEVAQFLLALGANIESANTAGSTPLFAAARAGQASTVKMLIGEGANSECLVGGSTPLAAAAEGGHMDVVKILAAQHAKVVADPGAQKKKTARKQQQQKRPPKQPVANSMGKVQQQAKKRGAPADDSRLPIPRGANPRAASRAASSKATPPRSARTKQGKAPDLEKLQKPLMSTRKPGYVKEAMKRLFGSGLEPGHEAKVSAAFRQMDKDKNGMVDCRELHKALQVLGLFLSAEQAEVVFAELDTQGHGRVSIEEYRERAMRQKMASIVAKLRAAASSGTGPGGLATGGGEPNWPALFNRYDHDRSGTLIFGEFRRMIRRSINITPKMITDGELRAVFETVDTDTDGSISPIEFSVFVNAGPQADASMPSATPVDAETGLTLSPRAVALLPGSGNDAGSVLAADLAEHIRTNRQTNARNLFLHWSGGPLKQLTAAQVQEGMNGIGRPTSTYEATQLIAALDRTGDAALSLTEFTHGIRAATRRMQQGKGPHASLSPLKSNRTTSRTGLAASPGVASTAAQTAQDTIDLGVKLGLVHQVDFARTVSSKRGETPGGQTEEQAQAPKAQTASPPARPELKLPTKAQRSALFAQVDTEATGHLSLGQIDKAITKLWPALNHKAPIMRAFKAADVAGTGVIGRREFRLLLEYTAYFNELWDKFEAIDTNHDHRISLKEFLEGVGLLGLQVSPKEAEYDFREIDENEGGYVTFGEFATWCARRHIGSQYDEAMFEALTEHRARDAALNADKPKLRADDGSDMQPESETETTARTDSPGSTRLSQQQEGPEESTEDESTIATSPSLQEASSDEAAARRAEVAALRERVGALRSTVKSSDTTSALAAGNMLPPGQPPTRESPRPTSLNRSVSRRGKGSNRTLPQSQEQATFQAGSLRPIHREPQDEVGGTSFALGALGHLGETKGVSKDSNLVARFLCESEGWSYDMVSHAMVLGRQLPGEPEDPDFCHVADDPSIASEMLHVYYIPSSVPRRFIVEVVGEGTVALGGVPCAVGDRLPLTDGTEITLGRNHTVLFKAAPTGRGYSKEWVANTVTASRIQATSSYSWTRTEPPILSSAQEEEGVVAAYYATLTAEDGSEYRLRKLSMMLGRKGSTTNVADCLVEGESLPARAVLFAATEDGTEEGRRYSIRCLGTEAVVTVNGKDQGVLDDPLELNSQDSIVVGGVELIFCIAGQAPQSRLINAATKLQASWRGYALRTSGDMLLLHDERDRAADRIQKLWARRKEAKARNPEQEAAAIKIQAAFRGSQTRDRLAIEAVERELAATQVQARVRGMQTRRRYLAGDFVGSMGDEDDEDDEEEVDEDETVEDALLRLLMRGTEESERGDYDAAMETYAEATALGCEDEELVAELDNWFDEMMVEMEDADEDAGEDDEEDAAADDGSEEEDEEGDEDETVEEALLRLLERGQEEAERANYDAAEATYEEATALECEDEELVEQLEAWYEEVLEDMEAAEAEEDVEEAGDAEGDEEDAVSDEESGEDESEEETESDGAALLKRGLAETAAGNFETAEATFESALELEGLDEALEEEINEAFDALLEKQDAADDDEDDDAEDSGETDDAEDEAVADESEDDQDEDDEGDGEALLARALEEAAAGDLDAAEATIEEALDLDDLDEALEEKLNDAFDDILEKKDAAEEAEEFAAAEAAAAATEGSAEDEAAAAAVLQSVVRTKQAIDLQMEMVDEQARLLQSPAGAAAPAEAAVAKTREERLAEEMERMRAKTAGGDAAMTREQRLAAEMERLRTPGGTLPAGT